MKIARGQAKKLLRNISKVQDKIGYAMNLHYDDRSKGAFEKAQELLKEAFNLCVEATSEYDPSSYDPTYD